ncbi:hypothetical protein CRE_30525 [Caenorhabditis remanei]|uniref:HAT C-terminal dimerisation domain-containing protein n=1 Tax=Caenorhabditis remanei TaxID=31234 RepID=E3NK21_CAERE|nr:hypothetical protein CRE_30525 [Caenorhabditis remanei]
MARKIHQKHLQQLVENSDPRILLGDPFRRETVKVVLYRAEGEDEFEKTGRVACTLCNAILSETAGSHIKRHVEDNCKKRKNSKNEDDIEEVPAKQRKMTEFNQKKLLHMQIGKITSACAKFCLRSGKSFNFCSSSAVTQYASDIIDAIVPGFDAEETMKQLPTRNTIQKHAETYSKDIVKRAFETVSEYAGKRLCLLVDHGKLIHNYLSIYGSFVDEHFRLQLIPLGFTPALEGKSIVETARLIASRFEENGISEDVAYQSYLTADGALSGLSNHFRKFIRCVSHSLNLLASRSLKPLDRHIYKFDNNELKILSNLDEIMMNAGQVSNAIRTNVKLCEKLSKLPALSVQTRWLIGLKCLVDIVALSEEIQSNFSLLSNIGKQAFSKLSADGFKTARTLIAFFDEFLTYNDVFQSQKEVSLHLVLPLYKRIEERWRKYIKLNFSGLVPELLNTEILPLLAKSGLTALDYYYQEFSDIHYAAVLLSPGTKRMQMFEKDEIKKAKNLIREMLPRGPSPPKEAKKSEEVGGIESLYALVSDSPIEEDFEQDELKTYLSEHVEFGRKESVESYWRRKKNDFPQLYDVAAQVFSIVPSESVCETAFSTASYLLDKRRTRLGAERAELVVLGCQLASKFPEWL